jgi:hypothetical protein
MNSIHDSKRALFRDCAKMRMKDSEEMSKHRTTVLHRTPYCACPITLTKNSVISFIIHQIVALTLIANVSGKRNIIIYYRTSAILLDTMLKYM